MGRDEAMQVQEQLSAAHEEYRNALQQELDEMKISGHAPGITGLQKEESRRASKTLPGISMMGSGIQLAI